MAVTINASTDVFADPFSDPVGYDQASRTHTIYSEDFNIIGVQPYIVNAYLTEYPEVEESSSAMIEFVDPCPDPESVTSVIQDNPESYLYTVQSPSMRFTLKPFMVEPPVCNF